MNHQLEYGGIYLDYDAIVVTADDEVDDGKMAGRSRPARAEQRHAPNSSWE